MYRRLIRIITASLNVLHHYVFCSDAVAADDEADGGGDGLLAAFVW